VLGKTPFLILGKTPFPDIRKDPLPASGKTPVLRQRRQLLHHGNDGDGILSNKKLCEKK
jgi:hypothetical protein